jgi:hypothetical protein
MYSVSYVCYGDIIMYAHACTCIFYLVITHKLIDYVLIYIPMCTTTIHVHCLHCVFTCLHFTLSLVFIILIIHLPHSFYRLCAQGAVTF